MNRESHRIPTHDYMGNRVKVGERACIFTVHGIHYEGIIEQVGGKRWFAPDCYKNVNGRFGGIGNCYLMKT